MPELPEVETVVRGLNEKGLVGQRIVRARVHWPRSITNLSGPAFISAIKGRRIRHVARRGKYLVIDLSGGYTLLLHLRMTGRIVLERPTQKRPAHERFRLGFRDGRIFSFRDPRKFGRAWLTRDPDAILNKLGPEPLSLQTAAFRKRLSGRHRQLKPLLLDQSFIAGMGNIYTDEALWEAGLHPLRKSDSLDDAEAEALLQAIKKVLRRGVRNLGTTLGGGETNFVLPDGERGRNQEQLRVYRQTGLPCARCDTPIKRIVVGQRSTHICPVCQQM